MASLHLHRKCVLWKIAKSVFFVFIFMLIRLLIVVIIHEVFTLKARRKMQKERFRESSIAKVVFAVLLLLFAIDENSLLAKPVSASDIVDAADFGYAMEDATHALQCAIDSGARRVTVSRQKGDWCIGKIRLRSNQEIVFADGVVVRALPGGFRKQGDCMFSAMGVSNVVVRGEGNVILMMNKMDYQDAKRYEWSEWRHLLSMKDSALVSVSNLTLSSSGGDGIYVARCSDVGIRNVICRDHHRQGLSVISARNLHVRDCVFTGTSGTPPSCGIDFEPNNSSDYLVSNLVENCIFSGNARDGVHFHIPHLSSRSDAVSIVLKDCHMFGNAGCGVGYYGTWDASNAPQGTIRFERCTISGNSEGALSLSWQAPSSVKLFFSECILDGRGFDDEFIVFDNSNAPFNFGGVFFDRTTVFYGKDDLVAFYGMDGQGIKDISGIVEVKSNGAVKPFDFCEFAAKNQPKEVPSSFRRASVRHGALQSCRPSCPGEIQTPTSVDTYFNGRATFALSAPAAGAYPLVFNVSKKDARAIGIKVKVTDAVGTPVDSFAVTEKSAKHTLRFDGKRPLFVEVRTGAHAVALETGVLIAGVMASDRLWIKGGQNSVFYFKVPSNSKSVQLEMLAGRKSRTSVCVFDEAGQVRFAALDSQVAKIADIERVTSANDEIWSVQVATAGEGAALRLGGDVIPVFCVSKECMFSPAE